MGIIWKRERMGTVKKLGVSLALIWLTIFGWIMAVALHPLVTGAEELTRWDFFSISNINFTLVLFVGIALWLGNVNYKRQTTWPGKILVITLGAILAGTFTYLLGAFYIPFGVAVE